MYIILHTNGTGTVITYNPIATERIVWNIVGCVMIIVAIFTRKTASTSTVSIAHGSKAKDEVAKASAGVVVFGGFVLFTFAFRLFCFVF